MSLPHMLCFGPQIPHPTPSLITELRSALHAAGHTETWLRTVESLTNLWNSLTEFDPSLKAVPGIQAVAHLLACVDVDENAPVAGPSTSPNVFTMPLTVLSQTAQYLEAITYNPHEAIIEAIQPAGAHGLCIGLLSALAISSARDQEHVLENALKAFQLSFIIGAYIDLDNGYAQDSLATSSLALRWRAPATLDDILETIQDYPTAYLSVVRDSTDVNITVAESDLGEIMDAFKARDVAVKATDLRGRCHSGSYAQNAFEQVVKFVSLHERLQLPQASELRTAVRSNADGKIIEHGDLTSIALRCIMIETAQWFLTFNAAAEHLTGKIDPVIVAFGPITFVPPSLVRSRGFRILRSLGVGPPRVTEQAYSSVSTPIDSYDTTVPNADTYPENAVAVIGMACRFPGADSVEEFWELLQTGKSMAQELPPERFAAQESDRTSKNKYWGNFINDIDAFDHRFFKKSAREAASTDPQQRILLEVAYHTLESSGYFGDFANQIANDVGCYLGVCSSDYNDNIASHPPTAYSSLGSLRAFLSGKISHHFGFTGPSVTLDTACSSSAVAINAACQAIRLGECSQALAGGVSLYTSPYFYQNLTAGGFLSPTGQTKPFDASADGYCRGEGIGLVMLKRLSSAVANNDNILGIIGASAVNQNRNCTAITVPEMNSQVALYQKAMKLANVSPSEVTFVEAHGTGTKVGDPIELESIRKTFGSSSREENVHVASVKGNIGHLEGASGVAGLIKILLMLQAKKIPVQASHKLLNPSIPALEPDGMQIPKQTRKWKSRSRRVAMCNNYGAAGSNAVMVVMEAPALPSLASPSSVARQSETSWPVCLYAASEQSLAGASKHMLEFVTRQKATVEDESGLLASIAFALARKENHELNFSKKAKVENLDQLVQFFNSTMSVSTPKPSERPTPILAFGGQASDMITVSRDLYEKVDLFRYHLDQCDEMLRSMEWPSIYPAIFDPDPVDDIARLHAMLFSVQYASAKAWIDCGYQPKALVGHSFGELTALAVSGILSLKDGMRLIVGRALLMKRHWGTEPGLMISIEADSQTVRELLHSVESKSKHHLEIACFNGPKAHVVVGSMGAVDILQKDLTREKIKFKILQTTHGFHSAFTVPLLPELAALCETLQFNEPLIPLFRCCQKGKELDVTPLTVTSHTREPVYFGDTISRISATFGNCFWLEAGSSSSIMAMIRRALDDDDSAKTNHIYQSITLTQPSAWGSICKATENLWEHGHAARFWPLHNSQSTSYTPFVLPMYAFERSKHWLTWSPPRASTIPSLVQTNIATPSVRSLLSLAENKSTSKPQAEVEFHIDPQSAEWAAFVEGHAVLDVPLCPAPLYTEIISRAIKLLEYPDSSTIPVVSIQKLDINLPLGNASSKAIRLSLSRLQSLSTDKMWSFEIRSVSSSSTSWRSHVVGYAMMSIEDVSCRNSGLEHYERLLGPSRLQQLRQDPETEVVQGSILYKSFSRVVSYADYYRGVRCIQARGHEISGLVRLPSIAGAETAIFKDTLTNPLAVDNFIQVAGVHANLLATCPSTEVSVCTSVGELRPSRAFIDLERNKTNFEVFTTFACIDDRKVSYDIYVCDVETGKVVFVILGALFTRVNIKSMTRILEAASQSELATTENKREIQDRLDIGNNLQQQTGDKRKAYNRKPISPVVPTASTRDIGDELRTLLHRVTDIPAKEFVHTASFDDVGIDSLMVTEVLSEICRYFDCDISTDTFATLTDMGRLIHHLESIIIPHITDYPASDEESSDADDLLYADSPPSSNTSSYSTPGHDMESLSKLVCEHLEIGPVLPDTVLADHGLDSLLCMELASDIEKMFNVKCDMAQLSMESTMQDLWNLVLACSPVGVAAEEIVESLASHENTQAGLQKTSSLPQPATLTESIQEMFGQIRGDYDTYARQTGFHGFWDNVYPLQSRLVLAYVLQAFRELDCDVTSMTEGDAMPILQTSQAHAKLLPQLCNILVDAGILHSRENDSYVRSASTVNTENSSQLLARLLAAFPQHEKEHRLLDVVGSNLAKILEGTVDPVRLLFTSKDNRKLLEEVYARGPMYEAISRLLCSFTTKAFANANGIVNILELGAGTGGTTRHITKALDAAGVAYTYTFTDISGSLVNAAKRNLFPGRVNFEYATVDIEKEPDERLKSRYHMVLSTNCIHATRNLARSMENIRKLLRPDGFCSLVEFTRNIFWFDIVFGVLEGWWLFNDGRKHVLASEWFWKNAMETAGYANIDWTEGTSEESKTLRMITGFNCPLASIRPPLTNSLSIRTYSTVWKEVGETSLEVDIYLPSDVAPGKRPIALLIHGGGHCLLTRKDVDRRQVKLLLDKGFLPVSFDYRLCPEINIIDGPMSDVCDALSWVRSELPHLQLPCSGLKVDGTKVAAVGWSAGGTLAMSLAFTAPDRNIVPPDAVLAFYCPTDFEDPWWQQPCFPKEIQGSPEEDLDFLQAVHDRPLVGYSPQVRSASGTRWSTQDARWRIISHMNWNAQHLPVLLNGLPGPSERQQRGLEPERVREELASQPLPSKDRIQSISPLAQIIKGKYKVPTVLVHGQNDDLIPWHQSQRTADALSERDIPNELVVLAEAEHLFDVFGPDKQTGALDAINRAYRWLSRYSL